MKLIRKPLLFKIFLTYFATAVLITSVIWMASRALRPEPELPAVIEKNVVAYLTYLQTRLNSANSEEKLKSLESELGVLVRVEGKEEWASARNLPTFDELKRDSRLVSPAVDIGRTRGFFFASLRSAQPRTVWFFPIQHFPRWISFPIVTVLGFILLILAMSFVTVRWMMSPIDRILTGVDHLSSGNLKYRIPENKKGEFQKIATTFNAMAARLERMVAAKERLLRDVSHELRSPLTRLNVAVDLMPSGDRREAMKEDLKRMEDLVVEVLESYRLKDGQIRLKKANTDITELVRHVAAEYASSGPGVDVHADTKIEHDVDSMLLERALRNLIENAIKYSREGSGRVQVRLEKDGSHFMIAVQDSGIGIAPEDLPSVFEPFFRVDAARTPGQPGFGLGLAIAKSVIEAHGGSIDVQSELGRGTMFRLRI